MRSHGSFEQLSGENVADGIALERPSDHPAIPMHVLQYSILVVGRLRPSSNSCARPGVAKVANRKPALEHGLLKIETDHDVQVVGHLVRVGANERPFDLVDGAIEDFKLTAANCSGKAA